MINRQVTLNKIFDLQQGCLKKHINQCKEEYGFVKDCLEFVLNMELIEDNLKLKEEEKKMLGVFRTFHCEALSTLINSFKLLLYGCPTDSLALLRVSQEASMMLSYIVEDKNRFKEVEKNINRGKYLKKLFREAKEKVKDNDKIKRDYGKLSNLGAHFYTERFRVSRFKIEDQSYPRCGMSIDPINVKNFIRYHINISLYLVRIKATLFRAKQYEMSNCFEEIDQLERRYTALAEKLKVDKKREIKESTP